MSADTALSARLRLDAAVQELAQAERAMAQARKAAVSALATAIIAELFARHELQAEFARPVGITPAYLTDLIHCRRYSPALARQLLHETSPC
ncbi:MAG: hypothetical protein IT355_12120 [Gemmatimonadaceae bacterium]|nr:hypothetical protein [Gemmatimonadaceae bacterium]